MTKQASLQESPKNICILRLSAIGDVCHMVSVVQRIQHHWPNTKISWVIGKTEASLLTGLPGIEFIIFDKRGGLKSYWALFKEMRKRPFDVLIQPQTAFRASVISIFISAKLRVGYDRKRAKDLQWLFTNAKIPHTPKQHVLESFHSFGDFLGVPASNYQWQIPIDEIDDTWAQKIINPATKTLIITPSSSVGSRNWLAEGYAEVACHAIEKQKMEVILCGGPTHSEKLLADKILALCPKIKHNLTGKTSLKQMLALLKYATVLIAPDTGPAHMATMVKTPVIGLYANTNPDRARPYFSKEYLVNRYPEAMQIQHKTSVDQLPWGKRSYDGSMMKLITPSDVISKLSNVLLDFEKKLRQY